MADYETIIGLEVHAQLSTASKMFCPCATSSGSAPNRNICPVCTGHPGTLPVVNEEAITMAIKAGLALGSEIRERSVFARKNYFYPDLPKGYQISQYEYPLCTGGGLEIRTGGGRRRISLIRIHLEEDAGKSIHDQGNPEMSDVDFNRCGVPLIEIVSGPDMRSTKEAGDYLRTLRNVLVYLGICEGNLQEGNFRCDANVSIRPVGQKELGTRTEMKNLNSFKAVERALAFEVKRQAELLDSGGKVVQETRLWNDAMQRTEPMRTKEEAHDYRYFPDPDLMPLIVGEEWIEGVRKGLPELAGEKADRFVKEYGIREDEAAILTNDKRLADYFEATVSAGAPAKKAVNWILNELLRELKNDDRGIEKCPVYAAHLANLIGVRESGIISDNFAKVIFERMYKDGSDTVDINALIEKSGLKQISDSSELEKVIDKVIADNGKQVEQYRSGKQAVFGFFIGQVMKATKGQANPKIVNELLKKKLG
jgi:aspartyl-tRNA(Asn)/glutamyl-tRNA(Gln) amidotransferase subunit B